jgi:hypothetical protein
VSTKPTGERPDFRASQLAATLALLLVAASVGAAFVEGPRWLIVAPVAFAFVALGFFVGRRGEGVKPRSDAEAVAPRQGSVALTVACGAAIASVVAGPSLGEWVLVIATAIAAAYFSWIPGRSAGLQSGHED